MNIFYKAKNYFELQSLIIISYPKSGRTWLRVMLSDLGYKPNFSHAGSTFHQYDHDYTKITNDVCDFQDNKIILLTRDPRDTVISYYHQLSNRLGEYDGTLEDFLEHPQYGLKAVCAFNTGWIKSAHMFKGFYHIRYEDLKSNPFNTMKYLLNFIGVSHKDKQIEKSVNDNEFSKMQTKEKNGELEKRFPKRFTVPDKEKFNEDHLKVRKGKAGGYKNILSDQQLKYCETIMREYGYDSEEINILNT